MNYFPAAIDSTLLAAFRSCPQKAFRAYYEHWKPKGESVHLVAGKAFARGIEIARQAFYQLEYSAPDSVGLGLAALIEEYGSFECPADSAKSLERTCGALEFYFDQYRLGFDSATPIKLPGGKRGIEFSFAEPLPILHPITGDPLLYTGRADMVADFAGGVYIFDEKTTSSLGPSWSKQWDMRSQFTGYTWAARRTGIPVAGVIVRGVSILKTKYDTQQAITNRAQWEIDRWEAQTLRDIQNMLTMWKEGFWDYNLDHSCSEYGGCQFLTICKSPNPEEWLPMSFERRVWDPLAREEMSVKDYEEKLRKAGSIIQA